MFETLIELFIESNYIATHNNINEPTKKTSAIETQHNKKIPWEMSICCKFTFMKIYCIARIYLSYDRLESKIACNKCWTKNTTHGKNDASLLRRSYYLLVWRSFAARHLYLLLMYTTSVILFCLSFWYTPRVCTNEEQQMSVTPANCSYTAAKHKT